MLSHIVQAPEPRLETAQKHTQTHGVSVGSRSAEVGEDPLRCDWSREAKPSASVHWL